MAKESKSARVRAFLAEGMPPKDIAKKLRISPSYVHTIKWQWQNKGSGSSDTHAASQVVATALPAAGTFKDRIDAIIAERVNAYLDRVLS